MSRPLLNRRIVVTRSPDQAPELCARLEALGATPLVASAIEFVPLPTAPLDAALAQIGRYDWLIFTSANAVRFFMQRASELGVTLCGPRIAASGSATADLLRTYGHEPDFVPAEFVGERLVAGLEDVAGRRVLLPRARIGRPEIAALLQARGALLEDLALYDTVRADPDPHILAELAAGFDAATFTSPSSVRNFLDLIGPWPDVRGQLDRAVIACIGPITANAASAAGLLPDIVPGVYTIDALVDALAAYFASIPDAKPA